MFPQRFQGWNGPIHDARIGSTINHSFFSISFQVKHERLLVVSVLGFLVNIVGIFAFQHAHAHSHGGGGGHGHSHGGGGGHNHSHGGGGHESQHLLNVNHNHSHNGHGHGHSHDQPQLQGNNSIVLRGVYLHILADTLGSVGVIISTVLMQTYGWMIADPICSVCIGLFIAYSVLGLIKDSIKVLMQRQPESMDRSLPQCYQQVTGLAGVYSVQDPHFWTLCSDVYVGTIKLEVSKNVDPTYVVTHTRQIFEAIGVKQIVVQLDYVWKKQPNFIFLKSTSGAQLKIQQRIWTILN